jgi:hypothetical protein
MEGNAMRRLFFSIAAATIAVSAATLTPASAMTPGTGAAIQAALAETSPFVDVAYVCRHRYQSSRRVCWWVPGRPHRRHWRHHRRW